MPNNDRIYDRHIGLRFDTPVAIPEGVDFSAIALDGTTFHFRLERRALDLLGTGEYGDSVLERFETHRDAIEALAKTLVMLGVDAEPIVLKAAHFASQPWRRSLQPLAALY